MGKLVIFHLFSIQWAARTITGAKIKPLVDKSFLSLQAVHKLGYFQKLTSSMEKKAKILLTARTSPD